MTRKTRLYNRLLRSPLWRRGWLYRPDTEEDLFRARSWLTNRWLIWWYGQEGLT